MYPTLCNNLYYIPFLFVNTGNVKNGLGVDVPSLGLLLIRGSCGETSPIRQVIIRRLYQPTIPGNDFTDWTHAMTYKQLHTSFVCSWSISISLQSPVIRTLLPGYPSISYCTKLSYKNLFKKILTQANSQISSIESGQPPIIAPYFTEDQSKWFKEVT